MACRPECVNMPVRTKALPLTSSALLRRPSLSLPSVAAGAPSDSLFGVLKYSPVNFKIYAFVVKSARCLQAAICNNSSNSVLRPVRRISYSTAAPNTQTVSTLGWFCLSTDWPTDRQLCYVYTVSQLCVFMSDALRSFLPLHIHTHTNLYTYRHIRTSNIQKETGYKTDEWWHWRVLIGRLDAVLVTAAWEIRSANPKRVCPLVKTVCLSINVWKYSEMRK